MSSNPSHTLSFHDLKRHNNDRDCWIAVHSKIYDITNYLDSHPGGSSIILRYAGSDATAAYDEIHAPGIIEEALPPECYKGLLDQAEVVNLPPEQKEDMETIEKTTGQSTSTETYTKPELFKLISTQDFVDVARNTLTPKAWAFYSSAATDLVTHHWNSDVYRRIMLRPRVMRNVAKAETRRSILGCPSSAPFFISPAAMARLAHPDGELALARGCASEGLIQVISNNASYPLASVIQAGCTNQPFFFQLYVNADRAKTTQLLRKARELGVKAIFVTVDAHVPGKREADERIAAENVSSAISGAVASNDRKGGGMGRLMGQYIDKTLSWDDIPWIQQTSRLPVVVKGIQSAADAKRAVEYGVQGIVLSNHGGRSLDTAQPSMLTLLELHRICPEIFHRCEVYVDGGITRGTDILKALALGATAVGIGRPFLYSLCYGQEGVEHLSQILKDELETSMRLAGITDVGQAGPGLVNTRDVDYLVPGSEEHDWIRWRPKAKM
ncbi:hypothetical protein HO173_005974 [Letharia columbiana]|uniref:L-lactate dehydrogenase (cytochrome) n=1 Tax=Letharia columbiana TaxID=112416 RepID=A0A8H6FW44_9LECA|nr:uncharacterized protein HO173_005974 [Letharia columbiana]KAF6235779.1 hypothetical protein HO173_005974 [Letharia columbiana]